jgi:hypothetical protein
MSSTNTDREHSATTDQEPILWYLHLAILFFVALGAFIIVFIEIFPTQPGFKDAGIAFGGILIGFISLSFEEHFRARPERRRMKEERVQDLVRVTQQRDEDRRHHGEEREKDLERFLALESELSASKRRAHDLLAQLELVGSHERSRIFAALHMGYWCDRRDEKIDDLHSLSNFNSMALKLGVPPDELDKLKEYEMEDLVRGTRSALELNYGPVVSGAFDVGHLLRKLEKGGFDKMQEPAVLDELELGLRILKCDFEVLVAARRFWNGCKAAGKIPDEALSFFIGLFRLVSGRFLEIARSPREEDDLRRFIREPIRIPKVVRIENVSLPADGAWSEITVYGRPVVIHKGKNGALFAADLDDLPTEEERRWRGGIRFVRSYSVRVEEGVLVLERTWGYDGERPPLVNLSVESPSDPADREPKVQILKDIAPPSIGQKIIIRLGTRHIVVFNSNGTLYGVDEGDLKQEGPSFVLHQWDVRVENGNLEFYRCWRYIDE